MDLKSLSKYITVLVLLLGSVLFSGCAKKDSADKNTLQRSNVTTPNARLPNITAAQTVNVSGTQAAINFAATQSAQLEWVQSFTPVISSVDSNEIVVLNVFEINGVEYDIPTMHPATGGEERLGIKETYDLDQLQVHTDSACLDRNCTGYVVSVVLSRDGYAITQNLVYVDFSGQVRPYNMVNRPEEILSLSEFVQLLYAQ